jgi:hypothetical protein
MHRFLIWFKIIWVVLGVAWMIKNLFFYSAKSDVQSQVSPNLESIFPGYEEADLELLEELAAVL